MAETPKHPLASSLFEMSSRWSHHEPTLSIGRDVDNEEGQLPDMILANFRLTLSLENGKQLPKTLK